MSGGYEKQRLFVDMDGTLAVFKPVDELETLYEEGYFKRLAPQRNVVEAVRKIIMEHPEIEVNILSAYLTDSEYALKEKNEWLDRYLPEIDQDHRIFVACGADKKEGIRDGIRKTDFLLDDYTKNLNEWQPPARGIKLLNGINHTRGSWAFDRFTTKENQHPWHRRSFLLCGMRSRYLMISLFIKNLLYLTICTKSRKRSMKDVKKMKSREWERVNGRNDQNGKE